MNKGNWQIKILTLFMAVACLCLTAACGDSLPDEPPRRETDYAVGTLSQ